MKKSTFRRFLLFKLPLAWVAGIRLHSYSGAQAQMRITYRWITQNPFKSMFWAAQGMAAELSTGLLCMNKLQATQRNISMLVRGMEAKFVKKATGKIVFTCEQGAEVDEILQKAIQTGKAQSIVMKSVGRNEAGDRVAEFKFNWSFKLRD